MSSNFLEVRVFKNEIFVSQNKGAPDEVNVSIFHDKDGNIQGISIPTYSFKTIEQLNQYKNTIQSICFQWDTLLKHIPQTSQPE